MKYAVLIVLAAAVVFQAFRIARDERRIALLEVSMHSTRVTDGAWIASGGGSITIHGPDGKDYLPLLVPKGN